MILAALPATAKLNITPSTLHSDGPDYIRLGHHGTSLSNLLSSSRGSLLQSHYEIFALGGVGSQLSDLATNRSHLNTGNSRGNQGSCS